MTRFEKIDPRTKMYMIINTIRIGRNLKFGSMGPVPYYLTFRNIYVFIWPCLSCGMQAQWLQHVDCCPAACGILVLQPGLNLHLLRWKVDS